MPSPAIQTTLCDVTQLRGDKRARAYFVAPVTSRRDKSVLMFRLLRASAARPAGPPGCVKTPTACQTPTHRPTVHASSLWPRSVDLREGTLPCLCTGRSDGWREVTKPGVGPRSSGS